MGGQRGKKKTVEDRSTKLHSQALFALRMQALIMFDVPFSHYLVCWSVVGVKSSAKDQHSKTLKRGCQRSSAVSIRWADSASCLLHSEGSLISERALVTILYDRAVIAVSLLLIISVSLWNYRWGAATIRWAYMSFSILWNCNRRTITSL